MRAYVGVTDRDWYRFLLARPELDEVNFWQPSGGRDLDEPTRRELLSGINRNSRTLDGLVSSLLDFARLGAETQQPDFVPCSVRTLVDGVADRLETLFADHALSIDISGQREVVGDLGLLERVL